MSGVEKNYEAENTWRDWSELHAHGGVAMAMARIK